MSSAVAPIFGVLGSCMGCMVFVENIAKQEPAAMNLMTFSTFLFIATHGLIFTSKFFTVANRIPLKGYVWTVSMFFIVNVVNNQALNFHVPVPLHIIFRSGSLLATLLLSVFLIGKRYSARKYISVFAITVGIIVCTLATSAQGGDSGLSYEEASKHYKEWSIGIGMLTFALLASAYLAICQQQMYETYGKHPDEAMFITRKTDGKSCAEKLIKFIDAEKREMCKAILDDNSAVISFVNHTSCRNALAILMKMPTNRSKLIYKNMEDRMNLRTRKEISRGLNDGKASKRFPGRQYSTQSHSNGSRTVHSFVPSAPRPSPSSVTDHADSDDRTIGKTSSEKSRADSVASSDSNEYALLNTSNASAVVHPELSFNELDATPDFDVSQLSSSDVQLHETLASTDSSDRETRSKSEKRRVKADSVASSDCEGYSPLNLEKRRKKLRRFQSELRIEKSRGSPVQRTQRKRVTKKIVQSDLMHTKSF
ncbi:unnamed protein product [Caenorhabditis sp. 36 PRJEB53466]|nr:unnamed protein product [Caenorhabditis sp. 36 PRJEB53466]